MQDSPKRDARPSVISVDRDAALPRLDRADRGESGMNELHELNIASPIRYACVTGGTPSLATKHSQLKCPSCHAEQPIIRQIPIFVSRAAEVSAALKPGGNLTERHGILTTSPQENPAHAGDSATLLPR